MGHKKNGLVYGAILLLIFVVYIFRTEFHATLLQNYTSISLTLISWIPKLVTIIVIMIIAKILISATNSVLLKYFKYVGKEKEYYSVRSVVKYGVWIIALIGILSVIIGNLGVWLTSLGLIGFGVTFALQKPILNFVGWLTIVFNRTFSVGDRIKVGDARGDVLDIQVMYTIMDGLLPNTDELSGKIITIPNEMVLTGSVMNFTKTGNFLWDELAVDITYESDWPKTVKILKDVSFKVVNKYVGSSKDDMSEIKKSLLETLDILRDHHKEADNKKERDVIERKMAQVQDEKNNVDEMDKHASTHSRREPIVRVELKPSSVELNVRYLAHYKYLRLMKSEINSAFLHGIAKKKDIHIAYPHMHIVTKSKK